MLKITIFAVNANLRIAVFYVLPSLTYLTYVRWVRVNRTINDASSIYHTGTTLLYSRTPLNLNRNSSHYAVLRRIPSEVRKLMVRN